MIVESRTYRNHFPCFQLSEKTASVNISQVNYISDSIVKISFYTSRVECENAPSTSVFHSS